MTRGQLFTTATFIGYVLAGPRGALGRDGGQLFAVFAFVAARGPLIPRLRASKATRAFLEWLKVASLALMVVVTLELARVSIVDPPTALFAAVSRRPAGRRVTNRHLIPSDDER